ncbi:glycosyltransferase [Amycolatopsis japonica]
MRFVGPLLNALAAPDPGIPWDRLRDGKVLVATSGTVFTQSSKRLRALTAALADSDWTMILATGRVPVAALGVLPPAVIAHQWIPQSTVLRHADAFLTHGGMNSVLEAIACGVPMLVRPQSAEQRTTARRLEALGVARLVSRRLDLRQQIDDIAEDRHVGASVKQLQQSVLSAPTADDAAEQLLSLAEVDRSVEPVTLRRQNRYGRRRCHNGGEPW